MDFGSPINKWRYYANRKRTAAITIPDGFTDEHNK
jgi:hypothetical protein